MINYPLNIKRSEWENLDEKQQYELRQDIINYFRVNGFPHFKYDIEEHLISWALANISGGQIEIRDILIKDAGVASKISLQVTCSLPSFRSRDTDNTGCRQVLLATKNSGG